MAKWHTYSPGKRRGETKAKALRHKPKPRGLFDPYDKLRDDSLDFPEDEWEQREWDERDSFSEPAEPRGDGSLPNA